MHYAFINNVRTEAQPQLQGICTCCSYPVIAKCGKQKIWHWAHKSIVNCDSWWEPETEWHRTWKNNYPADWQEVSLFDKKMGEKHIADIRTEHGLVIEFQHSHIDPKERDSRERFYENMVWVVDGTRLKRDYPRFLKGKTNRYENTIFYKTDNPKIFKVDFVDWCFPMDWLKSPVPVIFDFQGDGTLDNPDGLRNPLYCLFPQVGKYARVAEISRNAFIHSTTNGEWALHVKEFIKIFKAQDDLEKKVQQQTMSYSSDKVVYTYKGVPLPGGRKEYLKRFSTSSKSNRRRG